MPYICTFDGKYLGEHDCKNYHFGDIATNGLIFIPGRINFLPGEIFI